MKVKPLKDGLGVITKAYKILPPEFRDDFFESVSELENNDNHINRTQRLRIHKIEGTNNVYRADVDKNSGWRIHFKYNNDNYIKLCDVLTRQEHDSCLKKIHDRKNRYK